MMTVLNSAVRTLGKIVLIGAATLAVTACNSAGSLSLVSPMYASLLNQTTSPKPVVPARAPAFVSACRDAVARTAQSHGAVYVEAKGASPLEQMASGGSEITIDVRIVYPGVEQAQVRQALIICRLDEAGSVVALASAEQPGSVAESGGTTAHAM
ncbi:hypothetical protein [Salinarimonas soli]|uniref:Uncharacterized protein n=1 Tax=Salinarimonas soli TaxID=1638099 RepID=A0A5B2VER6_9HYPH|nr:hypothetical protein [Salinarimonas soli]KAA2236940.1 hypothetical protein F0L46_11750 [Salinarimonas soli]